MKIKVYLRDTRDGYCGTYEAEGDYDQDFHGDPTEFNDYAWRYGNYSCDCNRSLFLYAEDLGDERELLCNFGDNIIVVDKIELEDGTIVYSEA